MSNGSPTALLLNAGHALDHLFLLVFATAVAAIAADWGMLWQDLMPYTLGAFVMFGVGSLPAGRLGDFWGRRAMMIVFFLGMGLSALLIAVTQTVWQLAGALTLMGVFSSIYHPVGIPMIVQQSRNPGFTIGLNGLAGNLGIAGAAILTGFLVQVSGWRLAFVVPGLIALVCGALFAILVPREEIASGQAAAAHAGPAAGRDDACLRGDDLSRYLGQPHLQLHHQRQRPAPDGASRWCGG